jgi:hypothetical protein
VNVDELLDHLAELFGVLSWDLGVVTLQHLFKEPIHVSSSEGRLERSNFVEHAAQRPQVALIVVGLVLPHLRAGVVGSACLGVEHAFLGDLGDVEVSQLGSAVLAHEDVGTLHVSVEDLELVQRLQSFYQVDEDLPNQVLIESSLGLLVLHYLLIQVSVVSVLHHDVQELLVLQEGFLIGHHIWMLNRCQYSNFIECILPLLLRQWV